MARNKLIRFWVFPSVAALCLIVVLLNPSIVFYSENFCFACIHIVVEALIVAVVLRILRKTDILTSWKAAMYLAVVVGTVMAINFLFSPIDGETLLPFILSVFAIFVFLNFGLLEIVFDINFWRACLISIIAGLINALMVIVTISAH